MRETIAHHTRPGACPATSISTLPIASDASSAIAAAWSSRRARGVTRALTRVRAGHQRAERGARVAVAQRGARALADDPAAQQHDDAVTQREQLVEVGRDHEHAGAGRRRRAQPIVDARDRAEVDAARRLRRDAPPRARGRDSSRAITIFCWLPPDSARAIACWIGRPDVELGDLRASRARATARAIDHERGP